MKNKKTRILIVEDNLQICSILEKKIIKFGYEVIGIANTGEKAIQIVKKNNPDLILMDIILKNQIDGIETAKIIMKIKEIPVIFVTGCCKEEIIEKTKGILPERYLIKPVIENDLFTMIKRTLER